MKKILLFFSVLMIHFGYAQMTINSGFSPPYYVQDILIGNPNFPVTTFAYSTYENFTNNAEISGIGVFNTNGVDIPIDMGLVLSTGNVFDIPGPNTSNLISGTNSWAGDADLENYAATTQPTYNASSIEFNFTATAPSISLDFLFVSEEYGQYECQFGDTFAFLLTNIGTGVTKNIALVPTTTEPISILTVRGGENTNCTAQNIQYFGRYNYAVADASIPSIDANNSPINFNGQTGVFVLSDDLIIGDTYHLKIVVADFIDSAFDSALFIRNDSFGAYPTIITEPGNIVIEDNDNNGVETFDLTIFEDQMLGNAIDMSVYSFDFSYHLSLADAEAGTNAIPNPTAYENAADVQEIFARMQNTYTGTGIATSFRITTDADLLSTPESKLDAVVVYPNPVVDELTIDTADITINSMQLYNISGQLIHTEAKSNHGVTTVDFSTLERGIYFLQIQSDQGKLYKRIVK
ncbi:MAG: choice-of-anchor L domain-containing protein [Bacteroidota bacterium]